LGKNTAAAIRSGLFWGAVGAVKELVAGLSATLSQPPQVYITGGDLRRLSDHVPQAEYVPHMVLGGIVVSEKLPQV
jgi:type III pantothenate kinase